MSGSNAVDFDLTLLLTLRERGRGESISLLQNFATLANGDDVWSMPARGLVRCKFWNMRILWKLSKGLISAQDLQTLVTT
jgi:hypothetical protein